MNCAQPNPKGNTILDVFPYFARVDVVGPLFGWFMGKLTVSMAVMCGSIATEHR